MKIPIEIQNKESWIECKSDYETFKQMNCFDKIEQYFKKYHLYIDNLKLCGCFICSYYNGKYIPYEMSCDCVEELYEGKHKVVLTSSEDNHTNFIIRNNI